VNDLDERTGLPRDGHEPEASLVPSFSTELSRGSPTAALRVMARLVISCAWDFSRTPLADVHERHAFLNAVRVHADGGDVVNRDGNKPPLAADSSEHNIHSLFRRRRHMPVLQHFPTARQADPNSCWACAAREIVNWYNRLGLSGGQSYVSDQALADAWAVASYNNVHADIHMQQSAAAALEDLRFGNNTDDHPLPTRDEISDEIHRGRPLLAIVGNALPVPSPNPDYQNGH